MTTALRRRLLEVGSRLVPIHHIPPRVDIIGALVLMLQVVGVLPHADADQSLGGLDVRLERLVGIAERRQDEWLGLRERAAAPQNAGRAGEGCGAKQEFQSISSVYGRPPWAGLGKIRRKIVHSCAGSYTGRSAPGTA